MRAAIRQEANKLIREFGPLAYDKALEAVRAARRRRNGRLEKYLAKVAQEVERMPARFEYGSGSNSFIRKRNHDAMGPQHGAKG